MSKKQKILLVCLVLVMIYLMIPDLQVNLFSTGRPSVSRSIYESKRRGVYVGDLKVISFQTSVGLDISCISDGWVEKSWATGRFYYSAHINESGFKLVLPKKSRSHKFESLIFKDSLENAYWSCCCNRFCSGHTTILPKDTISYNIYDTNTNGVNSLVGELVVVVLSENK